MPLYRCSLESLQPSLQETDDYELIRPLWVECEKYHDGLAGDHSHRNFDHDFSEWIKRVTATNPFRVVVAISDDKVVGFCSANYDRAGEWGDLSRLVVDQEYRNTGIGRSLAKEMTDYLRHNLHHGARIALSVAAGNESVMKLYASVGFELEGYSMALPMRSRIW